MSHNNDHHPKVNIFEKFATPISIIVAGALIAGGVIISKGFSSNKSADTTAQTNGTQTDEQVLASITKNDITKSLKINSKALAACINAKTTAPKVDSDTQLATAAGLRGTPHMVILTTKNGKPVQVALPGAQPRETIEYVIKNGALPAELKSLESVAEPQVITAADHVIGDPATAPATIIEYSDIDCPYCKNLQPTLQVMFDAGEIAWVYRHSPIPQLHPHAYMKALASECVAASNGNEAFWKYLDYLILAK